MPIAASGLTDVGRQRQANEDYLLMEPSLGLYVVCDGMGGHAAGEYASQRAAEIVLETVRTQHALLEGLERGTVRPEAVAALLRAGIEAACAEIFDTAQREHGRRGMGTTCTAAILRADKLIVGHVGDSRLMLHRSGEVSQLTQDHTFVAEALRQGVLKPGDAGVKQYGNIVTRAVGPQRSVLVDTAVYDIVGGDTLLFCSDGLHQYFHSAPELAVFLQAKQLEDIPAALIRLANERGGSDNITAAVVRVVAGGQTDAERGRSQDVLRDLDTLRRIELMQELSAPEIMRLAQAFTTVHFEAGDLVLREGDGSEHLYVIVQGSVEILRGDRLIAKLGEGDHFGEMALLNLRPRSATVRATARCRMMAIERAELYAALRQDGMLAAKFFWKMAQTLSLRLDDAYAMDMVGREAVDARDTMRFGEYPSRPAVGRPA